MRALELIRDRVAGGSGEKRSFTVDDYIGWLNAFTFQGNNYPLQGFSQTLRQDAEEIEHSLDAYVTQGYKSSGPVFALTALRMLVFSEARFAFQRRDQGRPLPMFTDASLAPLETPWPGGTTQDLLARMLLFADFGGQSYVTQNRHGHMRLLRPDWVAIIVGTDDDGGDPHAIDARLLGYVYKPGGPGSDSDPVGLLPNEVAHFAPYPDPQATYRGMSWLTPVIREMVGDKMMTEHKIKFLENGATPNLVVSLDSAVQPEEFRKFKEEMDDEHAGWWNAYKTLYVGGGADVTVAGADFEQLSFKATQGASETRLAAAAGIHPAVVGFSEGMQGSSLNAGNYGQARRRTADGTFHPLWRNCAGSLQTIIRANQRTRGAELIADTRDVPFLREDQKAAAEIQRIKAGTLSSLIGMGFTPASAKQAVLTEDFGLLDHTGLVSVQLQAPGSNGTEPPETPAEGDRRVLVNQEALAAYVANGGANNGS